jgi:hypothetical protein
VSWALLRQHLLLTPLPLLLLPWLLLLLLWLQVAGRPCYHWLLLLLLS